MNKIICFYYNHGTFPNKEFCVRHWSQLHQVLCRDLFEVVMVYSLTENITHRAKRWIRKKSVDFLVYPVTSWWPYDTTIPTAKQNSISSERNDTRRRCDTVFKGSSQKKIMLCDWLNAVITFWYATMFTLFTDIPRIYRQVEFKTTIAACTI